MKENYNTVIKRAIGYILIAIVLILFLTLAIVNGLLIELLIVSIFYYGLWGFVYLLLWLFDCVD